MNGNRPPNQPAGQPLYIGFEQAESNSAAPAYVQATFAPQAAQVQANAAHVNAAQANAAEAQAAHAHAHAAQTAQAAQVHAAQVQANASAQVAQQQAQVAAPSAIYIPAHTGYRTRQAMVAAGDVEQGIHFKEKKKRNSFGMLGALAGLCALAVPTVPMLIAAGAFSTLGLFKKRRFLAIVGLACVLVNPATHNAIDGVIHPNHYMQHAVVQESSVGLKATNRKLGLAVKAIRDTYTSNGEVWPTDIEGNMIVSNIRDSWGMQIRFDEMTNGLVVRSAGPDKKYESGDDIVKMVHQLRKGESVMTSIDF